jgi:mRNA interferase RelE/StbE
MFEVILTHEALRTYQRAAIPLARKLNRCFDVLSRSPYSNSQSKRLSGTLRGLWRYRIGDWRVIYRPDSNTRRVIIVSICPRGGAYK